MEQPLDKYLRTHSTLQGDALDWIEKQTWQHTRFPQMLSGPVQGAFLKMLVELTGAHRVLEIGTFTGYSAVWMASALPRYGHLDTLEHNTELEPLIRESFQRAGVATRVSLHMGDARKTLRHLRGPYELVYIDANRREYCDYYELLFDKVPPGGLIVVDDVLREGRVYENPLPTDRQTVGVALFNDMIAMDPRVENVILPARGGLNVIRKISM